MLVTINKGVGSIRKIKNNLLFEACRGPLPGRNGDYGQFSKTWIGSSRGICACVDRDLVPGCQSPAHFKHRAFPSSKRVDVRMRQSNFHSDSLPPEEVVMS